MTQITRKSVPMRGLILLLTVTLGAGLVLSGCGDDTPATTPAPAPPPPPPPPAPEPEPEPEPEAPGTPTGFHADVTENSITWHWNAVDGAIGYAVQISTDEMFDATDTITPTTETSFAMSDLPPSTTLYGRVAAAAGSLEAPLLSDWTTHVTGMTPAAGAPVPPAAPMGLSVSATGGDYIEWSWEAVDGATGYHIQFSMDESMLMDAEAMAVEETSYRKTGLAEGTAGYLRVRAVVGDLEGMWTAHLTGMTRVSPPTPANLMATATEDSITWTWDEVDGADGYQIQYSADGVFTGSSESMDAEGASYTKDGLAIGTSAFLRVRSTAGTGDDALTSGWTMPQKGTTMTPQPPAVPTGLAAEGGEGSITWTWDAVAGATGYEVQFSTDPGFSDAETMMVEEGTSYMRPELDASTRGYLRVRAVNDAGSSAWAPTVSGTTDAAVVPPPAALEVTFMPPEGANPMIADGLTDKAKAMATVNQKITVTSNAAATITADWDEDLQLRIGAGDEMMSFANTTWTAMQSVVVTDGVTFKATRAGTTGENADDVAYVTCGPFRCQSGMEAPEITLADSAKCTAWEPTLDLQVGLIDNSLDEHLGIAYDATDTDNVVVEVTVFDGLDLGWHYTSSLHFDVTHDLSIVKGTTKDVGDQSSATSLGMTSIGRITLGRATADENDQIYYALSAENDATTGATVNVDTADAVNPGSCQPRQHQTLWSYNDNLVSRISKPDDCFRLTVDNGLGRNYLDAYTVTMDPIGADVMWGKIDWWKDEEDLQCKTRSWDAVDDTGLDVCAMFQEEVDRLPDPTAVPVVQVATAGTGSGASDNVTGATLAGFNLKYEDAADDRRQFTAMWYLNDRTTAKDDSRNLYPEVDLSAAVEPTGTAFGVATQQDLVYGAETMNEAGDAVVSRTVWVPTLDDDYDPMYDDLGKVDNGAQTTPAATTGADDKADNFADDDDSNKCTADDGGTAKGATVNNGTLCNAEDVEIMTSVSFVDGLGYGCDPVKVEYTLTCDWDARGNRTNALGATPGVIGGTDSPIENFVKCEVEKN